AGDRIGGRLGAVAVGRGQRAGDVGEAVVIGGVVVARIGDGAELGRVVDAVQRDGQRVAVGRSLAVGHGEREVDAVVTLQRFDRSVVRHELVRPGRTVEV